MAEAVTKLPVKTEDRTAPATAPWRPFETLHREIDRLFDDFNGGWRSRFGRAALDLQPFWSRESTWAAAPAVDVAETDKAYEITAELAGMDEKNIEVKFADGLLTITGEKKEEQEEKKKGLLSERAQLRFLPALLPGPRQRRRRQDRSDLQERRSDGDLAKDRRRAEGGQEDRRQSGLTSLHNEILIVRAGTVRILLRELLVNQRSQVNGDQPFAGSG